MERNKQIQQIYENLAILENYRKTVADYPRDLEIVDQAMDELRAKLQTIMNVCPLVKQ